MDTVEKANGDATERRSAYAKASASAEASAYAKAIAAALCARTIKTADKYDPPSRLRASAFAEPTAAPSSCPTLVHILQYLYERVRLVISVFRLRVYASADLDAAGAMTFLRRREGVSACDRRSGGGRGRG